MEDGSCGLLQSGSWPMQAGSVVYCKKSYRYFARVVGDALSLHDDDE